MAYPNDGTIFPFGIPFSILLSAAIFQMHQCVKSLIICVVSSNVMAIVFAFGDKLCIIISGEISFPRPVYSIGNLPPFSNPTILNSRSDSFV